MGTVQNAAIVSCNKKPGSLERQPPVITRGCLCFLTGIRIVGHFGRRPYVLRSLARRCKNTGGFIVSANPMCKPVKVDAMSDAMQAIGRQEGAQPQEKEAWWRREHGNEESGARGHTHP